MDFSRGKEWWDHYFMVLAKHVSTASRDPSTQSGTVIARPDKTIASVGFNGFPRGCNDDPALYDNREVKYKRIIHSDMNAIINALGPVFGYTLYNFPFIPCNRCAPHIVQAGIKRVVSPGLDTHPERWRVPMSEALDLFEEAGVEFKAYVGPH